MKIWLSSLTLLVSTSLIACGSDQKPVAKAPKSLTEPAPHGPTAGGDKDQAAVVSVADDIRRACGITTSEAYFRYDSSRVDAGANSVLDKLAACFETGALSGRQMHLVGHADPRGDEEYNYVLGERRAQSVMTALRDRGMKRSKVSTTSRGELESNGSDESTWARDRRVDVLLGG